jgi:hypothetical protein
MKKIMHLTDENVTTLWSVAYDDIQFEAILKRYSSLRLNTGVDLYALIDDSYDGGYIGTFDMATVTAFYIIVEPMRPNEFTKIAER